MNPYEALKHAVKAHAGQVDKCGQPYILHPIAVAEALEPLLENRKDPDFAYEDLVVVAVLHDVLEDTEYGLPLDALTGPQQNGLISVTKDPCETYAEYIEGITGRWIASHVKLADLWHNLSPERQACLPDKERASLERRYLDARRRIWDALGYEWWPAEGDN